MSSPTRLGHATVPVHELITLGPEDVFKRTRAVNLTMAVTCRFVPPFVEA